MLAPIDRLSIDTLRCLAIDAVQQAQSGHPGLPLGAAPMAHVLWRHHLRHCGQAPRWPNRDRFVLSAGHGSALLYSLLHLADYDLSLADLRAFRQLGSRTPGHPEVRLTPGVEATTGPLGQGAANAVGMAMAERALAHRFNRPGFPLVDHATYALLSDGDIMEGICAEAASLAGHLRLGKLIFLYDANQVSLNGPLPLSCSEDVGARFVAYGWQVLEVADGDRDLEALDIALRTARQELGRPSLIVVHTTIGFGSPNKAGTAACHGSPLGVQEVEATKAALGWTQPGTFAVPAAVYDDMAASQAVQQARVAAWEELLAAYAQAHPPLAKAWQTAQAGSLATDWAAELPRTASAAMATREASSQVLQAVARAVPTLLAADADLSVSTLAHLQGAGSFDGASGAGRNIRCGVREHAMAAAANGIAYHGGLRAVCSTFFIFSDYLRPAVRLAALARLPVIYVWTHDSFALGEDGPTHQPIEQLMAWRAMPHLWVLRPADLAETSAAWRLAIERQDGPVALVLSRQKLPQLPPRADGQPPPVHRGAYLLEDAADQPPRGLLLASGSEVHLARAAQALLATRGVAVRVVSIPSWELFAAQPAAYRDAVLPPTLPARLAIEAGSPLGWERWVGAHGDIVGMTDFGASAPAAQLARQFGFTPEAVAERFMRLLPT